MTKSEINMATEVRIKVLSLYEGGKELDEIAKELKLGLGDIESIISDTSNIVAADIINREIIDLKILLKVAKTKYKSSMDWKDAQAVTGISAELENLLRHQRELYDPNIDFEEHDRRVVRKVVMEIIKATSSAISNVKQAASLTLDNKQQETLERLLSECIRTIGRESKKIYFDGLTALAEYLGASLPKHIQDKTEENIVAIDSIRGRKSKS